MIIQTVNCYLGASTSDPNFANVALLVGSNGSVTDESSHAATVTLLSSAAAGATAKFGSGSLDVTPASSYARVPDAAYFSIGSSPFTVECWVRWGTDNAFTSQWIMGQWDTSGIASWVLGRNGSTKALNLLISNGSTTTIAGASNSWVVVAGTWYYIAADFDGSKYRIYKATDGDANTVMVASNSSPITLQDSAATPTLGAIRNGAGLSKNFFGLIDEARLTIGTARYANDSGFPVPVAAFPRS